MDGAIIVCAATDGPMPQTREHIPVSYTHLDVYKRQVRICSLSVLFIMGII